MSGYSAVTRNRLETITGCSRDKNMTMLKNKTIERTLIGFFDYLPTLPNIRQIRARISYAICYRSLQTGAQRI